MKAARPAWQRALIAANARKAKAILCRCGVPVIAGLDDDVCAFTVAADVTALSWAGELACAVVQARPVFELSGKELHRRYPWRQSRPCEQPVLPEHRCNDPVPPAWTSPPNTRRSEDVDVPPF